MCFHLLQIQQACSTAETAIARFARHEIAANAHAAATFDQLKERIAKAIEFLQSVPAEALAGTEGKECVLKLPRGEMRWTGSQYLFGFVIPNFNFHMTTAYAILRHN
jgi:hypothetical protein